MTPWWRRAQHSHAPGTAHEVAESVAVHESGAVHESVTAPLTGPARLAWDSAQALWGVHMHDAVLAPGAGAARGAPAWFAFPPSITVDPEYLAERGVSGELESFFAHELGHHVLAPGSRADGVRIRHQMARTLLAVGVTGSAGPASMLSNMWNDLLVNERVAQLQRRRDPGEEPGIIRLGRTMYPAPAASSRLWWVYCRAYELLWRLPKGTFAVGEPAEAPPPIGFVAPGGSSKAWIDDVGRFAQSHREEERALRAARWAEAEAKAALEGATSTNLEVDAMCIADAVRAFGQDPVSGALAFGVLAAPYIAEQRRAPETADPSHAEGGCAADAPDPTAAELGRILGDPRLRAALPPHPAAVTAPGDRDDVAAAGSGQGLGMAETLALYPGLAPDDVIAAWYRTAAAAFVRPLRRVRPAGRSDDLPGPDELWEIGADPADIDWPLTLRGGPAIPGITTRRRSLLPDEPLPGEHRIDLDLYIDSSGSMPAPTAGSAAVLAGSILILSILRGGGRVRVTSFSGPGQVGGTDGFLRDPDRLIAALALFFGGGTTFPLDLYGARYHGLPAADTALARPAKGTTVQRHVVVLSDDGLTSMFGAGQPAFAGVAAALRQSLTTATLVLMNSWDSVGAAASAAGYDVIRIDSMDDAPRVCAELARVLHG